MNKKFIIQKELFALVVLLCYYAFANVAVCQEKCDLELTLTAETITYGWCESRTRIELTAFSSSDYHECFEWYQNDSSIGTTLGNKFIFEDFYFCESAYYKVKARNDYCYVESNIEFVEYKVFIPNVITPYNENGINVFMGGRGMCAGYKVEIFNKNNQKIFEGNDGWDGTYSGKFAEAGVYSYNLQMRDGSIINGFLEISDCQDSSCECNNSIDIIPSKIVRNYPNPIKDELIIESGGMNVKKIEICSLAGVTLMSENNFVKKISVSSLPQGIYLLKIYTNNGVIANKIIKN
jgi:hypothetical protein